MLVPYEMVVANYEALYLPAEVEKGVGFTAPRGGRLGPALAKRQFLPVTYCIDSTFTVAQRASIVSAVTTASTAWDNASGPLAFRHDSTLDGAGCVANAPFIDFRATRFQTGASQGSLPGESNQILGLPLPLPPPGTLLHELGHILGLMHEQFHSKSPLGCSFVVPSPAIAGSAYKDLTPTWDSQSVMQYRAVNGLADCSGFGTLPAFLSAGDKVTIKALYGS